MGSPWFNRQGPGEGEIVESGIYQVPIGSAVHTGYPVKDAGSIASVNNPPYTKYKAVADYDDVDGTERCLGVAENTILESLPHPSLRNIEFRHLSRDVALAKHAVRLMRNKDPSQTTIEDGAEVAPYPGGFQKWGTGMARLGTLQRGPCAYNELGTIAIDVKNVQA